MPAASRIRRQGGVVVMTIPSALLKLLQLDVGAQLELKVVDGELIARPMIHPARKRYSLAELLQGCEAAVEMNAETAWAHEGGLVGREIG